MLCLDAGKGAKLFRWSIKSHRPRVDLERTKSDYSAAFRWREARLCSVLRAITREGKPFFSSQSFGALSLPRRWVRQSLTSSFPYWSHEVDLQVWYYVILKDVTFICICPLTYLFTYTWLFIYLLTDLTTHSYLTKQNFYHLTIKPIY